jgi:hypothetical protein
MGVAAPLVQVLGAQQHTQHLHIPGIVQIIRHLSGEGSSAVALVLEDVFSTLIALPTKVLETRIHAAAILFNLSKHKPSAMQQIRMGVIGALAAVCLNVDGSDGVEVADADGGGGNTISTQITGLLNTAAKVLANLAHDEETCMLMVDQGVVALLIAIAEDEVASTSVPVLGNVATAMRNLARKEPCRKALAAQGMAPQLVRFCALAEADEHFKPVFGYSVGK